MAHGHDLPPPFQMMQMITGYWVSQIAGALAELGVADAIASGKTTPRAIAEHAGADPDAMARLITAAASLGIVKRDASGHLTNTPLGETLRSGVPGSMREMARANTAPGHWLPWGQLADAVRHGSARTEAVFGKDLFAYYQATPSEGRTFGLAMTGFSSLVAPAVASAIQAPAGSRVADVGGSEGALLAAVLRANAGTSGVLLDRPEVVVRARETLASQGLGERVECVGGDFFASVPSADVYLLKHILHDWDDERCTLLLSHCAKAMRPGGRVVVVELVLPDVDQPGLAPLMDINMLALVPGRERTQAGYAKLFEAAGLKLANVIQTKTPFVVLEATKA